MSQRPRFFFGWVILGVAGVSTVLAIIAALVVRDAPEQLGQQREGVTRTDPVAATTASVGDQWTPAQAIRTRQFALMLVCGVAYAVPWNALVPRLALHF